MNMCIFANRAHLTNNACSFTSFYIEGLPISCYILRKELIEIDYHSLEAFMMNEPTSLIDLQPGSSGSIYAIKEMNPILRQRLYDLGVHEGSIVSMKQRGPFGGPITLECNGQLLGIRQKEAREIEVSLQ